jgi:hypothetical protein
MNLIAFRDLLCQTLDKRVEELKEASVSGSVKTWEDYVRIRSQIQTLRESRQMVLDSLARLLKEEDFDG